MVSRDVISRRCCTTPTHTFLCFASYATGPLQERDLCATPQVICIDAAVKVRPLLLDRRPLLTLAHHLRTAAIEPTSPVKTPTSPSILRDMSTIDLTPGTEPRPIASSSRLHAPQPRIATAAPARVSPPKSGYFALLNGHGSSLNGKAPSRPSSRPGTPEIDQPGTPRPRMLTPSPPPTREASPDRWEQEGEVARLMRTIDFAARVSGWLCLSSKLTGDRNTNPRDGKMWIKLLSRRPLVLNGSR